MKELFKKDLWGQVHSAVEYFDKVNELAATVKQTASLYTDNGNDFMVIPKNTVTIDFGNAKLVFDKQQITVDELLYVYSKLQNYLNTFKNINL